MGIKKFNTGKRIEWGVETEGWVIKKLRELTEGQNYPLKGYFTTPNKGFGEGAVLISDGYMVGVPGRYNELIGQMMQDDETIEEVKAGKAVFRYTTFMSETYKRKGYTLEFDLID